MATELIDVIDTAVKIGLGGLITGIATFGVSTLQHRNEKIKVKHERECALLGELALNFEKIDDATDDFIIELNSAFDSESFDLNQLKKTLRGHLVQATRQLGEMKAKSNLLGLLLIFESMTEYTSLLNNCMIELDKFDGNSKGFSVSINSIFSAINELREKIYPELSSSYARLNT